MALQWQKLFLPAVMGREDMISDKIRPPESLTVLNGYFDKTGSIKKREGFQRITNTIDGSVNTLATNGNPKLIFSTGPELCVAGYRNLYAFVKAQGGSGQWADRGPISPFTGRLETIFQGEYTVIDSNSNRNGNFIGHIASTHKVKTNDIGTLIRTFEVVALGRTVDGHTTFEEFVLATKTTTTVTPFAETDIPFGVNVIPITGKLLFFYITTTVSGGPHTLNRVESILTSPQDVPSGLASVTTDVRQSQYANAEDSGYGKRMYDVIGVNDGGYVVAWIEHSGAGNIALRRFNASHVQQASGSVTALSSTAWRRVAIADSPTLDRIYILTFGDISETSGLQVELFGYRRSDLTSVFGPVVLEQMGGGSDNVIDNLGVVEGTDRSNNTRVACIWRKLSNASLQGEDTTLELHTRSTDTNGLNLDTLAKYFNASPVSKPFNQNKRFYCSASVFVAGDTDADLKWLEAGRGSGGFCTNVIIDLDIDGTGIPIAKLAGLFDFGLAPTFVNGMGRNLWGNGNNFFAMASAGVFRTSSHSAGLIFPSVTVKRVDELELTFDSPISTISMLDGFALIGGGYLSFYDGMNVFEHGFIYPPIPSKLKEAASGAGFPPGGVYHVQYIWKYLSRGILHRSIPSPVAKVTIGGVAKDLISTAYTYPFGHRTANLMSAVLFVAGPATNDIPLRAGYSSSGSQFDSLPNRTTLQKTEDLRFGDPEDNSEVLYTFGGNIENATPEGCSILAISNDRIHLGGFYRRNRFQYSKPFTPGTAGELFIAPEFNEGFGYIVNENETGISQHDDGTLYFTEKNIYYLQGSGPDDRGLGNDFSGPKSIFNDTGCVDFRSVVNYPDGTFFQSKAGLYEIDRGLNVVFTGQSVKDLTDSYPIVTSAVVVPDKTHVRFTLLNSSKTAGIVLVFDYRIRKWMHWEIKDSVGNLIAPISATIHNKEYYILEANGKVWKEDTNALKYDDGVTPVKLSVKCNWILKGLQAGWQRIRKITALGERKTQHNLDLKVMRNYNESSSETFSWTNTEIVSFDDEANRELVVARPTVQKVEAIKMELSDSGPYGSDASAFTFHGFMVEYAIKSGVSKLPDVHKK